MADDRQRPPGNAANKPRMDVKIADEELKGRYANLVRVSHTREEFILDFINFIPPQGMVNARVIMSPGHLKRFIGALHHNLDLYEKQFGAIHEATDPAGGGPSGSGPIN